MSKSLNILFVVLSVHSFSKSLIAETPEKAEYIYDCKADREAIAALEFLKAHTEFGLSTEQMRNVSIKVSEGCTGSAKAFITITELLIKSKLDSRSAITHAQNLASSGIGRSDAFLVIFKRSFAREFFDLDLPLALKISLSLSADFKGDPEIAAKDFQRLSEFCTSNAGLGLSREQCASVIQRVILANTDSRTPIGERFSEFFKFLTDSSQINLTAGDAIRLAEKLAAQSPEAFGVFRNSYEYALSDSGLKLPRSESIKFATEVAVNTKQPRSKLNKL